MVFLALLVVAVGSDFVAVDMNTDGASDSVASTDRGAFVFFNPLRAGRR
jgi:hypothetical protein